LTLQSQGGDFIGQGRTFDITYTPTNSDFFFARTFRPIGGSPALLSFALGTVTRIAANLMRRPYWLVPYGRVCSTQEEAHI